MQDNVEVLSPDVVDTVLEESNAPLVNQDDGQKLLATLQPLVPLVTEYADWAEGLVVHNEAEAAEANARLKLIAGNKKLVETTISVHKEAAKKKHSLWCTFEQRFTNPLDAAYRAAKKKVQDWQLAEQEKAAAEQRRLQAIADEKARKERERQEQEARRQREIEEAARREADEKRRLAEKAEGDEKRRLQEEADRKEREANKAAVKADTKAEQAATTAAPTINVAAPKSGVRIQKRWKVKTINRPAFIAAAAVDANIQGFITIEETRMERAKAANPSMTVPGVEFHEVVV